MEKGSLFEKYGQVIKAGRVIFKEGEQGDSMYIIQKGRVKITKRIGNVEKILMVLQKGDFFGEMAIVNQMPRTATATSVDNCELLCFNRPGFLSMISKNSNIAMNIIEKLCLRLQKADNAIRDLTKRDMKPLVISALNDLIHAHHGNTQAQSLVYADALKNIADQIGASQKEVEAEIQQLIGSEFLSTDGYNLEIINIGELERIAGFFNKK
jgi:CRP/FNR family cyclic AMP-dependent transcriptional regulator